MDFKSQTNNLQWNKCTPYILLLSFHLIIIWMMKVLHLVLLAMINHKPIPAEIDNEPVLLVFLATSKLFRKATINKGATLLS